FLTYSNGEKRILLDGYVGSDKYTSVWCLGLNNLWGNLWTYISGTAVLYDSAEEKTWVYINYEDYNYSSVNYVVSNISGTFEQKELHLLNKNYVKLTYNLPNINGYYRYAGTSQVTSGNGLQSIIGLPSQGAIKDSSNDTSSFNDLFWASGTNGGILGICRGGTTQNSYNGGLNGFNVSNTVDSSANMRGFRTILVS
ncbi:MAG: hypothetical protein IJU58_03345, partial [Clostridia bacterium]|nr:hypothetical protein [Clostridia bacterium]